MNLRREFRSQLTRGAYVFATVEGVSMGKATVRLANNGARLTNCPILGANVSIGERVVVDYSAEGKPIVRPYTIYIEQEEIVEQEEEKEPKESTFCYAKYTISDEELANPSMRVYVSDAAPFYYADPGYAAGSFSGQYRYQENFVNYIPFDEPIVDTIGIRNTNWIYTSNPKSKGVFVPPRGSYWFNLTFALNIRTNDLTLIGAYANLWCQVLGVEPDTGYNNNVKVSRREHHVIFQSSFCAKWEKYQNQTIRVGSILDSVGNNIYTNPSTYWLPDLSRVTYMEIAKVEGKYPILEMYKIADMGSSKTCIPGWGWNEYDYPGQ